MLLQENARITLTKMARRLQMTRNAIKYRIRLMEKEGLIRGYTALVDPLRLDYSSLIIIDLDVRPSRVMECIEKLQDFEEVFEICRLSGETTLHVKAFFKNNRHQNTFITERIERLPIERYSVRPVVQIVERRGIPVLRV